MKIKNYILIGMGIFLLNAISSKAENLLPSSESIILQTIKNIEESLIAIKTDFPQLSEIETATIKEEPPYYIFTYEKGFISDSKIDWPTFKKNGADILVKIIYPTTKKDEDSQLKSGFVKIKDGIFLEFWVLVRTEPNKTGLEFCEKIKTIIHERIEEMIKELKK